MREDLGNARLLAGPSPDAQGIGDSDLTTDVFDLVVALLEQLCNAAHSICRRNKRIGVKTELAGEVATGGAERQHRSPRQEMIQRLLLYGIDTEAAGAPVGVELHRAVFD